MQPEIYNDELFYKIIDLVKKSKPKTVLEIGSGEGLGSTAAFIRGIELAANPCNFYCIELDPDRFKVLVENTKQYDFVKCYNVSSVRQSQFIDENYVAEMYNNNKPLKTRQYSLELVWKWLEDNQKQLPEYDENGIQKIMAENNIDFFDMVLIDGSPFTGLAELLDVYGAKTIILDDTIDIKNWDGYNKLKDDDMYELVVENKNLRNGYAIFEKRV